jgi:hypothetical protein
MLLFELYFLLYRLPKKMTKLARARGRSALAWSFLAIGVWLGTEFVVAFTLAVIYQLGVLLWGWSAASTGMDLLIYALGLTAALIGATIVSRILESKPANESFPGPPPPPQFLDPDSAT